MVNSSDTEPICMGGEINRPGTEPSYMDNGLNSPDTEPSCIGDEIIVQILNLVW